MTTFSQNQIEACRIEDDSSIIHNFLKKSSHILKAYSAFNLTFILLGLFEIVCCLIFFNLLTRSNLLAITLATFLMTLFSYLILRTYFQAKKPEQLLNLCIETLGELTSDGDHHNAFEQTLAISTSLMRISGALKDCEYSLYQPPKGLESLQTTFEKLGCWLHWKDFHFLKEWFYIQAANLYIELIKENPDDLQLHVALANNYVLFSGIYSPPKLDEDEKWVPLEKFSDKFKMKFKQCAQGAIEEFKILNDYNPEDPWVYTQLAYSYHDLNMPQEEIQAYETLIALSPEDDEALYKLGTLYFQQGLTAKGLKIYEKLKSSNPQKASSLVKHYGQAQKSLSIDY